MSTAGSIAHGTTLKYVPRSGASQAIGEITNISGIEVSADAQEFTNHASADRYREMEQALRDGGELSITANSVASNDGQALVMAHFGDDTRGGRRYMEIEFPDGSGFNFDGVVTSLKPGDAPVDGKIEFSAGFKVSGKPIYGASRATGLTTAFFALSEGDGTVSPAKASATYAYTASVANDKASLTITPTSSGGDSIYVEGELVASGAASEAIALDVGANVLTVIVYEDGYLPARYEITVTRAAA